MTHAMFFNNKSCGTCQHYRLGTDVEPCATCLIDKKVSYLMWEPSEQYKDHAKTQSAKPDVVNHPPHYTQHPSGVECIQITEHMGFTLGNAVKYIWRADLKADAIEDLKKARWYLDREIQKRETNNG